MVEEYSKLPAMGEHLDLMGAEAEVMKVVHKVEDYPEVYCRDPYKNVRDAETYYEAKGFEKEDACPLAQFNRTARGLLCQYVPQEVSDKAFEEAEGDDSKALKILREEHVWVR